MRETDAHQCSWQSGDWVTPRASAARDIGVGPQLPKLSAIRVALVISNCTVLCVNCFTKKPQHWTCGAALERSLKNIGAFRSVESPPLMFDCADRRKVVRLNKASASTRNSVLRDHDTSTFGPSEDSLTIRILVDRHAFKGDDHSLVQGALTET